MLRSTLKKYLALSFFILIFISACGDKEEAAPTSLENSKNKNETAPEKNDETLNVNDSTKSISPEKRGLASRSKKDVTNQNPVVEDDESFGSLMSKAESGEAVAQFKIAGIYEKGSDEVPQNLLEAAKWYRMAAEQNHRQSQYNLGMMYQSGHGVGEDANEANRWFERYNQNK